MKRRAFIGLVGAAVAWPEVARGQQRAGLPTIGMLGAGTPASHGKWIAATVTRLRELGWIVDRNITIEYRWAEGREERIAEFAADFLQMKADVIVTSSNQAVKALMKATSQIPIVAAAMTDPISVGFIRSLAQPGGNVTGFAQQTSELVGKRFELLREIVPDLNHIAIMGYSPSPAFPLEVAAAKAAAATLGMDVVVLELQQAADILSAIESVKSHAQAIYVAITPFTSVNQNQINSLALSARLPTTHGLPEYVRSGGLMSYGADFLDLFRRAGDHVDRILRGQKPSELPVEQPIKFDLVVNLKTAKILNLTIPATVLTRANEVVE